MKAGAQHCETGNYAYSVGMESRVDKLTECQREVLRLWARRQSAKEIARELGITHWAVNERLRSARRTLSSASSNEAALLLQKFEDATHYNRVVYEPNGVEPRTDEGLRADVEIGAVDPEVGSRLSVREMERSYRAGLFPRRWSLLDPIIGGAVHDLTASRKLLSIGVIAFGIVLAVGALISISSGVVRIVSQLPRIL